MFKKIKALSAHFRATASATMASLLLAALAFLPSVGQAIESQYVYVESMMLKDAAKTAYNVGDVIEGSFLLRNAGDKDAANISYKVSLIQVSYAAANKDIKQYNTIASEQHIAQNIGAKAKTEAIPFMFTIPLHAKGAGFELKVEAVSAAGFALSWANSDSFSIDNSKSILTIRNASVLLSNGLSARPEAGFVLHADKEAKSAALNIVLENKDASAVTAHPVVSVYAWPVSAEDSPVFSAKLGDVFVSAQSTSSLAYDIPTFEYAPGIYEGRIDFSPDGGAALARSLTFKYAVAGEVATIHSLTSSQSDIAKGEAVAVSASVTGGPADFLAENVSGDEQNVRLHLTVWNEKGTVIAEGWKDAELSKETEFAFSIAAASAAKAMRAALTVENADKKVLATYESDLSADYADQVSAWKKSCALYAIAGIILIMALIAAIIIRRKKVQRDGAGTPQGWTPSSGAMPLVMIGFAILAAGSVLSALTSTSVLAASYNTNPASLGFKYTVLDWFNYELDECSGKLDIFITEQPWYNTNWQDTPRGRSGSCSLGGDRSGPTAEEFKAILIGQNLITDASYNQTIFVSSPAVDAEYEPGDIVRISAVAKYTAGGFNTGGSGIGQFYMGTVVDGASTPSDLALNISGLPPYSTAVVPYSEIPGQTWGSTPISTLSGSDSVYAGESVLDTGSTHVAPNSVGIKKFWIGTLTKNRWFYGAGRGGSQYSRSWIQVKGYQEYKVIPPGPRNLITSNAPGCNTVKLTWMAPADMSQVDGYKVYRGTSATGPFTLLTTVAKATVQHLDVLPAGQTGTLYYQVKSYHAGTGFESRPASASFDTARLAPPATCAGDPGDVDPPGDIDPPIIPPIDPPCIAGTPGCGGGGSGTAACGAVTSVADGQRLTLADASSLCASGSTFAPASFIEGASGGWQWNCQAGADVKQCTAQCAAGTNYCAGTGTCESSCVDRCTNIDGNQTTVGSVYRDLGNGNCVLVQATIDYFRLNPDTAEAACPAFWHTTAPLGMNLACSIGSVPVAESNPEGTPGGSTVVVGRLHTLSCVQSVEGVVVGTTLTKQARCYRIPETIEQ